MDVLRHTQRAIGRSARAMLVLALYAGLLSASVPCALICGDGGGPTVVASETAPPHCAGVSPATENPPARPDGRCNDECDTCDAEHLSVPSSTAHPQLAMPDHGMTITATARLPETARSLARRLAMSPDDARTRVLDVLSQTMTLLI